MGAKRETRRQDRCNQEADFLISFIKIVFGSDQL
jgi:hypothetical protein